MTNIRDAHEIALANAWANICNRAGVNHDGLYNVATQSPDAMRRLGELMFDYMTAMSDNNDAYPTRDIAAIAAMFVDIDTYAAHRE